MLLYENLELGTCIGVLDCVEICVMWGSKAYEMIFLLCWFCWCRSCLELLWLLCTQKISPLLLNLMFGVFKKKKNFLSQKLYTTVFAPRSLLWSNASSLLNYNSGTYIEQQKAKLEFFFFWQISKGGLWKGRPTIASTFGHDHKDSKPSGGPLEGSIIYGIW